MLSSSLVAIVAFCRRFAVLVVLCAIVLSLSLGVYVKDTIKINTDIDQLMATDLEWRIREKEMDAAFPQRLDRLVVVVDGLNADLAEIAASMLAAKLADEPALFKAVTRPDALPYFDTYGLLFLSEDELAAMLEVLVAAQPMMGSLAKDPSLRGLFQTMALAVEGIKRGQTDYKALAPSFTVIAQTLEANMNGLEAVLPWQSMLSSRAPTIRETRKYIMTQPVLDFGDLSPGNKARNAVRAAAEALKLTPENGVTVRMTGSVALNDEEFASVAEGTTTATLVSVVLVFSLLFLALRSFRLILPILLTLGAGLVATTAFAMATIGSLNLISVAFAVMFVGIAVDFGIQFGVRFRDEHHKEPDQTKAMLATARLIAAPLSMAAAATIVGFIAFIPTSYRGVSELGMIAGAGMVVAYILNLTLLPALITLFKPGPEPESVGYAWAKPVDAFLVAHRKMLLAVTGLAALVGLFLAAQVRFDFDPLNLKNPDTESVSTMFDIMKYPDASPYVIQILAPSLDEANALAAKIEALPEVDHTITLTSFVPKDQEPKLAMIADAKFLLDPTLTPTALMVPPTDEDNLEAMRQTATALRSLGEDKTEAKSLAVALDKVVARSNMQLLEQLDDNMIGGMVRHLERVKRLLSGQAATLESITDDLRRDWMTADGRARLEVYPKGNARDHRVLTAFTDAVRKIAPEATGSPISIQESGKTVSMAFIEAGALGILFISLLGWVTLRRVRDVLLLVSPLILAGILTLGTMKAINLPLNFANVIALPLLLSLGVSYAIYFITYWKSGEQNPLSSSMARAVLFSAGTTLVAFGSLSLSSHTGTQSMGQLLTIALLYSLLCTFLVLPILLVGNQSVKQSCKGFDSKAP